MSLFLRYLGAAYLLGSILLWGLYIPWLQHEKKQQLQLFVQQYAEIVALNLRPAAGQLSPEQISQLLAELQFSSFIPISALGLYQQQGELTVAVGNSQQLPAQLAQPFPNQPVFQAQFDPFLLIYPLKANLLLAEQVMLMQQTVAWLVILPEPVSLTVSAYLPVLFSWGLFTILVTLMLLLVRIQQRLNRKSIVKLQQQLYATADNEQLNEQLIVPTEFAELEGAIKQHLAQFRLLEQQVSVLLTEQKQQQESHALSLSTQAQLQQQQHDLRQCLGRWLTQFNLLWQRHDQLTQPCFQTLLQLHYYYASEVFAKEMESQTTLQLSDWLEQQQPHFNHILSQGCSIDWLEGALNPQYQVRVCVKQLDAIVSAMLLISLRSDAACRIQFRLSLQDEPSPKLILQLNVDGNGLPHHLLQQFTTGESKDWLWRDADIAVLKMLQQKLSAEFEMASLDGLGVSIRFVMPVILEAQRHATPLPSLLIFDTDPERLAERVALLHTQALKVATCHTLADLQQQLKPHAYSAVVVMLPGHAPSLEWCNILKSSGVPVLCYAQPFHYSNWQDKIACFSSNDFSLTQLIQAIEQLPKQSPKRLLVVDDNETNQEFIKILLEHKPVSISTAYTAKQALERCQTEYFDMVLLDIRLPDQSGIAVAEQLRQLEAYRTIPLLAFTAHALPDEVAAFKAAGMNDILLKPLDPAKFDRLLTTYRLY